MTTTNAYDERCTVCQRLALYSPLTNGTCTYCTGEAKVTPKIPTEEMLTAAHHTLFPSYEGQENHQCGYDIVSKDDLRVIWKAMFDAAPSITK